MEWWLGAALALMRSFLVARGLASHDVELFDIGPLLDPKSLALVDSKAELDSGGLCLDREGMGFAPSAGRGVKNSHPTERFK
jgi:hypothetical protein